MLLPFFKSLSAQVRRSLRSRLTLRVKSSFQRHNLTSDASPCQLRLSDAPTHAAKGPRLLFPAGTQDGRKGIDLSAEGCLRAAQAIFRGYESPMISEMPRMPLAGGQALVEMHSNQRFRVGEPVPYTHKRRVKHPFAVRDGDQAVKFEVMARASVVPIRAKATCFLLDFHYFCVIL